MVKTMTRFYEDNPVRTVMAGNSRKWLYCAEEVCSVLTDSRNVKSYWATIKRKYSEISEHVMQLRLDEGLKRSTDVVDLEGVKQIAARTSYEDKSEFIRWASGAGKTLFDKSKLKAYELFDCTGLEIGTTNGLKQIHKHIYGGLYSFAGQIRVIKLGGISQIPSSYISDNLDLIAEPYDDSLSSVVNKYALMLAERPFEKGSGRSLRIWTDMLLRYRYGLCVDWSKVGKREYHHAMKDAPKDIASAVSLFRKALSDEIGSRALFMKGIDYSFNLDEEEESEGMNLIE